MPIHMRSLEQVEVTQSAARVMLCEGGWGRVFICVPTCNRYGLEQLHGASRGLWSRAHASILDRELTRMYLAGVLCDSGRSNKKQRQYIGRMKIG